MATPRYTFYFHDLASNTLIATLPLTEVRWTLLLNQSGTFSAKLPLSDRGLVPDPEKALAATVPEETICYIDRGGVIVGHGSILTRHYDLATDTLELGGQDLWYWMSRREISEDQTFIGVDMLEIQRQLVAYAQAKENGDLGILLDDNLLSGVTRDRTYLGADLKKVDEMCSDLAALTPGFEFKVRCRWEGNSIARRLIQAYPRFGVDASTTQYVWAHPSGAITDFTWPEDGTASARRVYAQGTQSTDGTREIAISSATPAYPLTETSLSYDASTDSGSLQEFADAQQAARAQPLTVPEVEVYGPIDPVFGAYSEGDCARYRIRKGVSGRWWNGMDSVYRIIGLDITLNSDGSEKVKHLLSAAV